MAEFASYGGHEVADGFIVNIDVASVFKKQDHLLMVAVLEHDVQSVVVGRPVFRW